MIFHENRLLADDSHVISYLIFVENWERCRKICRLLQLCIGALRVKVCVFEDKIVTLFDVLSVKSKVLQDHLRQ